ncbi:MAG TPA: aminomethyl-transferring glycine dehydrogenase subunit GcvPB [Armatimonadota bacterium]|nr:aminomethyl-transferring glycine dehydrogenase subunit GcvPB [Armatimonadota bacterium]
MSARTVFEKSRPGRRTTYVAPCPVPPPDLRKLPEAALRAEPPLLPELTEGEVVRHYTNLARRNWAVDVGFYPLGSCTMKYNSRLAEDIAAWPEFFAAHPLRPTHAAQGLLRVMYETERMLAQLCGMARFTLQPAAGAQGELCGMLLVRAYHADRGDRRNTVIVPDSAHGTNPATAALAGFKVVTCPSSDEGRVDLTALGKLVSDDLAGIMLTNPNTLGIFERDIQEISRIVHDAGGLVYYDGANFNAFVGRFRPGDMGFDVVHLNLHKTFGTPHGGGGPGAGPVGVVERLEPYLPVPLVAKGPEEFELEEDRPKTIGRMNVFAGSVLIVLRAYVYMRLLGTAGLRDVSGHSVLAANYLKQRLSTAYRPSHSGRCMHEFVLTAERQKDEQGVRALDIAKRLIDLGFHPPTMYFPLTVPEALMIEPTETESLETLDAFVDAMLQIDREARESPDLLHDAPHHAPVGRLDEVAAAKNLNVRWTPDAAGESRG